MSRTVAGYIFVFFILYTPVSKAIVGYEVEYFDLSTRHFASASLDFVSKVAGWLLTSNGMSYSVNKLTFKCQDDGLYVTIVTSAILVPIIAKVVRIID